MTSYLHRVVRHNNHDVELTVRGEVDPRTGMVLNITSIDDIVRSAERAGILSLPGQDAGVFCRCLFNHWQEKMGDRADIDAELSKIVVTSHSGLRTEMKKESNDMITTRTWEFCASHRLHNPVLSDEENVELYGVCNNANGHGHNFTLDLSFHDKPPVDIEEIVEREVYDRFDHKHLNEDCPEFANAVPTTEYFTMVLWKLLTRALADGKLYCVRLRETRKNSFSYYG